MTIITHSLNLEFQFHNLYKAMVAIELLLAWGATYKKVKAGEFIFHEGGTCFYYFQLIEGQVRWDNLNPDGKEFIQSIIEPGESFGDIPLYDDLPYAANAIANHDSVILCLPKQAFLQLLAENPAIHLSISRNLAKQLRLKFMLLKTIALENPEIIIRTVLNQEKCKKTTNGHIQFPVKLTRQQIANMTGLRVETVIRTIRQMSNKGELEIDHGKVFLGV